MTTQTSKRQLEGEVVSARANKTRVVLVTRVQVHPKYGKRFRTSERYQAHDELNAYQVGDRVVLEETRPYSRTKRFRIISKAKA